MGVLYTDIEPFSCEWLRNLIAEDHLPGGVVLEKDIREVTPDEVKGYEQCHWFAGVGGWPLALRLAGVLPGFPVWTASCPCQPFSTAGKQKGEEDERHLWPTLFQLVKECHPPVLFGEQVASDDGYHWLARVRADLEEAGYAVGCADLPAAGAGAGAGAPHIRQRLFFGAVRLANAQRAPGRQTGEAGFDEQYGHDAGRHEAAGGSELRGATGGLGQPQGSRPQRSNERDGDDPSQSCDGSGQPPRANAHGGTPGGLGNTHLQSRSQRNLGTTTEQSAPQWADAVGSGEGIGIGPWDDCLIIPCRDGKWRRISAQRGDEPLAHGLPRRLGQEFSGMGGLGSLANSDELRQARASLKRAKRNRVGRLKGYGNAIVPQVATLFIRCFLEVMGKA